jgi:hypothetical protein
MHTKHAPQLYRLRSLASLLNVNRNVSLNMIFHTSVQGQWNFKIPCYKLGILTELEQRAFLVRVRHIDTAPVLSVVT